LDEGSATSFFEAIDVNSSTIFSDAFFILFYCQGLIMSAGRIPSEP
jgi:hypothetical protein